MKMFKKYSIKIPKHIQILYISKKDIIILTSSLGQKSIKLKLKIFMDYSKNIIYVTSIPNNTILTMKKSKIKSLQGTIVALLKQCILELSVRLNKQLRLVGVGYKVFSLEMSNNVLLHFRLGFSHSLFFKLTSDINVLCIKSTNLYIFGNSLNNINMLAAKIRAYKVPEVYKGKGILYKNEIIKLKEGKKV